MISEPHRKVRFHGETVRNALGIRTHPPQQEKVSSTNATCWAASFSVITSAGGMISIPSWRSHALERYGIYAYCLFCETAKYGYSHPGSPRQDDLSRNEEIAEKIESLHKVFSLWVTEVRTGEMEQGNSE